MYNYLLFNGIHMVHTAYLTTYFLFNKKIITIWILHMSFIVILWGMSNYMCPLAILKNRLKINNTTPLLNVIMRIESSKLNRYISLFIMFMFILYGFYVINELSFGVIYIIILIGILKMIRIKKWHKFFNKMDTNTLMILFFLYIAVNCMFIFFAFIKPFVESNYPDITSF